MATLASLWCTTLQLLSALNTCNKKKQQQKTGMSLCHHCNLLLHQGFEQKKKTKRQHRETKKVQIYTPALSQRLKIRASAKHSKTKQQR